MSEESLISLRRHPVPQVQPFVRTSPVCASIKDFTDEDFPGIRAQIETNLSALSTSHAALPVPPEQGSGHFVQLRSSADEPAARRGRIRHHAAKLSTVRRAGGHCGSWSPCSAAKGVLPSEAPDRASEAILGLRRRADNSGHSAYRPPAETH